MSDSIKKEAAVLLKEIEDHMNGAKKIADVVGFAFSFVCGPLGPLSARLTVWLHNGEYRGYAEELREVIRGQRTTIPERPEAPYYLPG